MELVHGDFIILTVFSFIISFTDKFFIIQSKDIGITVLSENFQGLFTFV